MSQPKDTSGKFSNQGEGLKMKATGEPTLGRGLESLFGGVSEGMSEERGLTTMPVTRLISGKYQPRKEFAKEHLLELAQSIKKHGILQPILVRHAQKQDTNGHEIYEIIAGERRYRAAMEAGLSRVPIIVRHLSDSQVAEGSLIENIQRQDLNPVEEAMAIKRLSKEFDYRHDTLAEVLGKSRSHITNMLRILNLPEEVLTFVAQGKLTLGHAKLLLGSSSPLSLAHEVLKKQLSVRALESLLKKPDDNSNQTRSKNPSKGGHQSSNADANSPFKDKKTFNAFRFLGTDRRDIFARVEKRGPGENEDLDSIRSLLSEKLSSKVEILFEDEKSGAGKGAIMISFEHLDELDHHLQRLMKV